MSLPLIGLTTYHAKNQYGYPIAALMRAYTAAIQQAGGAPVLIPSHLTDESLEAVSARLDGFLFTGGGDIDVACYGGEPHPKVDGVDLERDATERALLQSAVRDGKPFLGICRGFQMVNVTLGGSLLTHIADQHPNALKHDYFPDWPRDHIAHPVRVEPGTRLAEIFGVDGLQVNSLHHQGAKQIAPGLCASAFAPDGLLEAVELPGHPFGMAVQWHPEWLTDQLPTRRLFRAFVEASQEK